MGSAVQLLPRSNGGLSTCGWPKLRQCSGSLGDEGRNVQLAGAGIVVCEPSEFGPVPSSASHCSHPGLLPDSDVPVTSLIQASAHTPPVWKPFY